MTTTPVVWRSSFTVNSSSLGVQEDAHVVRLTDGFFVVWLDAQAGDQIVGQRYDLFGNPVNGEVVLANDSPGFFPPHATPDIAERPDGQGFVLVWRQPFIPYELKHQIYDANGKLVSETETVGSLGDLYPVVATTPVSSGSSTHLDLIAWVQTADELKAQIVGPNGPSGLGEFTIVDNPGVTGIGEDLAIVAADSGTPTFYVAWSEEYGGGDSDIKLARITDFHPITNFPAIISTVNVTANTIESFNPELMMLANGNVLATWTIDGTGGVDSGIRARIFTPSLLAVGTVFNPLTTTSGNQDSSTIVALEDGGFVIFWDDGPSQTIRGQRYSDTAAPVGNEFIVATSFANIHRLDAVMLDSARFVVTWDENGEVKSAILDSRGPGVLNGTAADDFIIARVDNTVINGLGGNDTLLGYIGNDTIDGGLNNDLIDGGAGNDVLSGGPGVDRVSYASAEAAVTVYLAVASLQNTGGGGADTISGFENLTGSRFADFLYGTSFGNDIEGGDGDDFIRGYGGNGEHLKGQGGNDTIFLDEDLIDGAIYDGGAGIDTLDIQTLLLDSNHVIDLGFEFWDYVGGSFDVVIGIENVLGGGNGETIYGSSASNVLHGNGGDDKLFGREGNDSLFGGSGNDILDSGTVFPFTVNFDLLEGGLDNDTYIVSHTGVAVVEYLNEGTDEVKTPVQNYFLPDNVENIELTMSSGGPQLATGNSLDNVILSAPVGGDIDAGAGDDIITGQENADFITGGPGEDRIDGAGGADTARYIYSGSGVDVSLVRPVTIAGVVYAGSGLFGDAAGDGLLNIESISGSVYDDTLTGDAFRNILTGYSGNDVLYGASGNDNLFGGAGEDDLFGEGDDDYISGGAGADYLDGGDGFDTVDFSSPVGVSVSGVTVNLVTGLGSGGDADGDTIKFFEKVIGTEKSDVLISDNLDHVLVGGLFPDELRGNGGVDTSIHDVAFASATIIHHADGSETVSGFNNDVDTLIDMEWAQFDDAKVWIGPQGNHFNDDGQADVLWRHSSGLMSIWNMNNDGSFIPVTVSGPGNDWVIAETGDFNGDGWTDVVWRHSGGGMSFWHTQRDGGYTTVNPSAPSADWSVQGTGDFNRDGNSDILWRNQSGFMSIWNMTGEGTFNPVTVAAPSDTQWEIAGVGDFNGDARTDVLWRHASGHMSIWHMNDDGSYVPFNPQAPGAAWKIEGVADFNGDRVSDILWRHDTGFMSIWHMNTDGSFLSVNPTPPGSDWQVQTTGDYNNDGRSDILWRHDSGTIMSIWHMNADGTFSNVVPVAPGTDWMVQ